LLSQVTKEDTFDSVLDPQEIINVVLKAFPEFHHEFESIWNEIIENSTTNLIDYPIEALKEREYNLNSGMLPFYRFVFLNLSKVLLISKKMKIMKFGNCKI
jgi:hypothetical protein